MATTTSTTSYNVIVTSTTEGTFSFYYNGVTDADALALGSALKSFPWPASQGTVTVSVYKNADSNTQYSADLSANPAVFQ